VPVPAFYEVRGGPVGAPFVLPDSFDAARSALGDRFPHAQKGIDQLLGEMEKIAGAMGTLSRGPQAFQKPLDALGALKNLLPAVRDWTLSLSQKLDRLFGRDEAVKCAIAANLPYYHDDPDTLWWVFFAMAQGSYLLSGGRYVQTGSQRLSSALARAIKTAGSEVLLRRVVTAIGADSDGRMTSITHTAKDGSDPQTVETCRVVSDAAPQIAAAMMPPAQAKILRESFASKTPSISLFSLTLGLSKPPREVGLTTYSTQLLPGWMTALSDFSAASSLMAGEPADRIPPLAIVDYAAIDAKISAPPYSLSIVGPDRVSNWEGMSVDAYRDKRARWQEAIVRDLDKIFPGLANAVVASSFNTAFSVQQYLNAPNGAVYGFAPTPPATLFSAPVRSPATPFAGFYLASAYTSFGGYSGVIQSAGACADMILRERA
jgi:phytoene dehydrogenase-like protein